MVPLMLPKVTFADITWEEGDFWSVCVCVCVYMQLYSHTCCSIVLTTHMNNIDTCISWYVVNHIPNLIGNPDGIWRLMKSFILAK